MPHPPSVDTTADERPLTLTRSVQAFFAAAALSLIGAVINIAGYDREAVVREALAQSGEITRETAEAAATFGLVLAGGVSLFFVALVAVFTVFLRMGKNWARVMLTILGVIGVLFTLIALTNIGAGTVLDVGSAAAFVLAIVLAWKTPSTRYIEAVGRRRY